MSVRGRLGEIALVLWTLVLVGSYLWSSLGERLRSLVAASGGG